MTTVTAAPVVYFKGFSYVGSAGYPCAGIETYRQMAVVPPDENGFMSSAVEIVVLVDRRLWSRADNYMPLECATRVPGEPIVLTHEMYKEMRFRTIWADAVDDMMQACIDGTFSFGEPVRRNKVRAETSADEDPCLPIERRD